MSTTIAPANGAASSELNPFGSRKAPSTASVEVESQRAIAETQAAMVIAQRFPRDTPAAMDRILQAFTRPTLAEKALYSYARGGTDITGPSIRAAEAIAQEWGNVQYGVRELEQRNGASTVETYCWDVQTNTRSAKTFQVPHIRHTKKGQYRLEDPRDVYELIANQGARRLRACILSVIPSDVIEAAIKQAETTLKTRVQITPDLIQSLLDKFAGIGVPRRALEAKIQRRVEAITPALVVQLGKIFNSVEDGMSVVQDHFDLEEPAGASDATDGKSRADALAERLGKKAPAEGAATTEDPAESKAPDPAPEAQKPEPPQAVGDDAKKRKELRTAIVGQWKEVGSDAFRAMLTREFAKSSLPDLTTAQLERLLADTAQLLEEYG